MMMKKLWWIGALMAIACSAIAQDTTDTPTGTGGTTKTNETTTGTRSKEVQTDAAGMVTITSKGRDVRDVITDLFSQSKKNFVIENVPRTDLFLSLNNIDFDETFAIICRLAKLDFEIQNGIYYITRLDPNKPKTQLTNRTTPTNPMAGDTTPTTTNPKFQGRLPQSVLEKKITTRFNKTDFREVIKAIARQADLWIEVDPTIQARRIDAYLIDTTLKQALDMLTSALGLEYKFTENMSIMITKTEPRGVRLSD